MPAATYNLNIEKGVDFSIGLVLQREDGQYVDLTDTGVCVKAEIVEFYGLDPITGFFVTEIPPSGITLSLNATETLSLPYDKAYYDVVVNTSGFLERLKKGEINISQNATKNISC